jgi:hypothetical protein
VTSKKLGALLRSVPPAIARAEVTAAAPLAAPELVPGPPVSEPPVRQPPVQQPITARLAAEPEVPLQVLVPKHIRIQLGVKAAQEGHSLRALILTGIRSLGITVTDEEIRDKRGRRNP